MSNCWQILKSWAGRGLAIALVAAVFWLQLAPESLAIRNYVRRYLASEPVPLAIDAEGQTRPFTPEELEQGKRLFENNCINCHVGGITLPEPNSSLSLADLESATPPLDNINALVTFFREPTTHDGQYISFICRQVSERWMDRERAETLAAFILRAAQVAPAWGTERF